MEQAQIESAVLTSTDEALDFWASIFSITPVTQEYCVAWSKQAQNYDFKPVPYIETAPPSRQLTTGDDDEGEEPGAPWEG